MSPDEETSRRRTDVINRQSLRMLRSLADLASELSRDDGKAAGDMAVTIGITATLGLVFTLEANWGVRFSRDALRAEFERVMRLAPVLYERAPDGSPSEPHTIQ